MFLVENCLWVDWVWEWVYLLFFLVVGAWLPPGRGKPVGEVLLCVMVVLPIRVDWNTSASLVLCLRLCMLAVVCF